MAILALISLFGSTVGWIVVSSEVPYQAAKEGLFPAFFAKTNKTGSPVRSLFITNFMTQLFLFSTVSGNGKPSLQFSAYCSCNTRLFSSISCFCFISTQIDYHRRDLSKH